jgi:mRNA interferase HigB
MRALAFENSIALIPLWDRAILLHMRVISNRTLRGFWLSSPQHEDSKAQLEAWHSEAIKARWNSPQDIKAQFRSASILNNNRVVFNIAGNKYRLIVAIDYKREACFIKFIGTHKQYDQINAETV